MKIEGQAARLTIYLGETDQVGRRPLYHEIVARAREMGLGCDSNQGFRGVRRVEPTPHDTRPLIVGGPADRGRTRGAGGD